MIGQVFMFSDGTTTLEVAIETNGDPEFILLKSKVDAVDALDCDRDPGGDDAYINGQGNFRIGTGDSSSTISSKRSENADVHVHMLDITEFNSPYSVTLEASLFAVDSGPKHAKGYLGNVDGESPGKAPHGLVECDID